MAKVTPEKIDLFEQEIQSGSAASEDTMQRVAASVNFWNSFYEGQRGWFVNGNYSLFSTPIVGIDGAYGCITDMDVYGFTMFNLVAGTSGNTELDIQVTPAVGAPYSLFSTKPVINFQSGNTARIITNVTTNTVLAQSSFTTLPVFSTTQLNAGDLLTLNLNQAQVGGQSCGLILALRPR
jgi:hypothetical protein